MRATKVQVTDKHNITPCQKNQEMKTAARWLATATKPKTALFLMNMGGPATQNEVHSFLLNLFSDKDLIPLPFQSILAPLIARRRTPKIMTQYAEIGGGSPIKMWTEKQGHMLEALMDLKSPETAPHKSYVAFRYAAPLTEDALDSLKNDGVTRAIAFTLYPQYSCSTTGSSLNALFKAIKTKGMENTIKWSVVDRWFNNPGLVNTFATHIKKSLAEYPEEDQDKVVLIFSAHSLPMSVVNRGDPYPAEVAATVAKVMEALKFSNPYRLVWQSQVGPSPWLGPKTNDAIEGYASKKIKNLLLIPIAFVSDIEYGALAKEKGIGYKRVESLNDDPMFIEAMGDIVKNHIVDGKSTSKQMMLRCPSCINEACGHTKEFFGSR